MLKRKWESTELNTYDDWCRIRQGILDKRPKYCAFDTETTGLHIINDRPFLFQFGFLDPDNDKRGFTFLVDLYENKSGTKIIQEWHKIVEQADLYIGHHVSFDIHMLYNIGIKLSRNIKLTDTQFYIRYACDALHQSEGGPPLALKDFAARYIDINAKYHEQELKKQRTELAKIFNNKLKKMMGCTLKQIEEWFKDPIFEVSDLPEDKQRIYKEWINTLPFYLQGKVHGLVESDMIRYNTLNYEMLYKYAHLDIVYTLETFELLNPILQARDNQLAVDIENSNIIPNMMMERAGLLVDKEYLESSRQNLRDYIKKCRSRLAELAERELKIGQHQVIKAILRGKYDLDVESTGSQALSKIRSDGEAKEFISLVQELRSLEKWYSTYIMKFKSDLVSNNRIYTSIHQVGTVSGRVSCDFQQFPKEPLLDSDGKELFHPRRMVLVPPDCTYLAFIDYAAEELRVTAMYTMLVGSPDENLLRAYMPYNCDPETWEPTDLHSLTTVNAGIPPDDPDFSYYRKHIGKVVNFA